MSIIDAFRLDGKVAVVTGANTGLGQGMSVALAQAGAKVVGVARRSCEDTKKLIEADGGEFAEVIADLSDMSAIDVIVNGALAAFGKVDILVNNAGLIKRNDAIDFTEDEWDSVIQVNQKMVTISFTAEDMASYDYLENGCYVLEAGDYEISINSDSHNVIDSVTYTVDEDIVYDEANPRSTDLTAAVNQFGYADGHLTYLSRKDGFKNYDETTAAPASTSMPEE